MLVDKQSELMSDLLFTVHQHGGDDVTWKPPILYTPFHFSFAAFALTKTVTYDVLMNLKTALLIAVKTIQRASDVLSRTDALKNKPKKRTATTPFVITYTPALPTIARIIHKHSI